MGLENTKEGGGEKSVANDREIGGGGEESIAVAQLLCQTKVLQVHHSSAYSDLHTKNTLPQSLGSADEVYTEKFINFRKTVKLFRFAALESTTSSKTLLKIINWENCRMAHLK